MIPSCFLTFTILVQGFLGSYVEVTSLMMGKLTVPMINFANGSIHAHYGTYLEESFVIKGFAIIQNITLISCIISALVFVPKMDVWGRKFCSIYFTPGIYSLGFLSWIIGYYLNAIEITILGSICFGIGIPIKMGVTKLYIAECAPDEIRGFTVMAVMILSGLTGTVLQFLAMEQFLGTDSKWILLYFIIGGYTLIFMFVGSFIPESPKFMRMKNQNEKKIIKAVQLFQGETTDPVTVIDKFDREILLTENHTYDVRRIFSNPALFNSFKLVLIASLIGPLGIIEIITMNSVILKLRYGFTNANAVLFDSVCDMIFLPLHFIMPFIIEKVGRRPVIIFNVVLSLASTVLIFLAQLVYQLTGPNTITMALSAGYSFLGFFMGSMGIGVFGILLITDLLPLGSKSAVSKIILVLNNLTGIIVNSYFSFFDSILGAFVHFPFVFFQIIFFVYLFKYLPETKQKAVYENYENIKSNVNSCRTSRSPTLDSLKEKEYGTFA